MSMFDSFDLAEVFSISTSNPFLSTGPIGVSQYILGHLPRRILRKIVHKFHSFWFFVTGKLGGAEIDNCLLIQLNALPS